MEDQMKFAFMQQGGVLRDDGMNTDPVSGNEVPSGSMAKEVRDDIDAKLSEGEYVVPADVVRFHGVQKFEDLRNQAKQGFGRMEQDGRIGGEPVNEDFPIPMNQLQTFDEGGDTSTYEQTFGQPFQMGQRYGDMGGATNRGYELITYTSPDGKRTIVIPHFNGKPMSAIPTGFAEQGTQTTGGGGVGTDDDSDRQEAENEAVQRRNMGQPVTVDPLMQAQIDKDRQLSQPKAPEDFTGEDFLKYVNQTKSFGLDDIARNVPIIGGLLSRQDGKIREQATKILKEGSQNLSQDQFDAMKGLVTTEPQQTFLGTLFGTQQDFTPDDFITKLDYKTYLESSVGKAAKEAVTTALQPIPAVPTTANTKDELDKLPTNTILSPDNATNIIRDIGKDMPFKGTMSENISKAMLGIREKETIDPETKEKKTVAVVNSPDGEKDLDAGTMQKFVENAKRIQDTVLEKTRDVGGGDSGRPAGSGPPSVQEIFNDLHGFDKGGLAAKPKPKPKRKRTPRKGLGNKTKAT